MCARVEIHTRYTKTNKHRRACTQAATRPDIHTDANVCACTRTCSHTETRAPSVPSPPLSPCCVSPLPPCLRPLPEPGQPNLASILMSIQVRHASDSTGHPDNKGTHTCHSDRLSLQGRFPMYFPFISRSALAPSTGSEKLTKPNPAPQPWLSNNASPLCPGVTTHG
jgi:hypothetical protein